MKFIRLQHGGIKPITKGCIKSKNLLQLKLNIKDGIFFLSFILLINRHFALSLRAFLQARLIKLLLGLLGPIHIFVNIFLLA